MTDRPFDVDAARALLSVDESWRDKKWSARQWTAAVVTFRDLLGEAIREIEATRTELVQARAEREAANAQAARALSAQAHRYGRLDQAVPSLRLRLRQALGAASQIGADDDWCEAVRALLAGTADLDLSTGATS